MHYPVKRINLVKESLLKIKNGMEKIKICGSENPGFGNYLGYDHPTGKPGFIPQSEYYNRWYNNSWRAATTISNSIGQGEILATPIQLANFSAIIANSCLLYTSPSPRD